MPNWDAIMKEAKRLEQLLRRADIDFNETEKALGYYLFKGCDDQAIERYLKEMANNPRPAAAAHRATIANYTAFGKSGARSVNLAVSTRHVRGGGV